jgi:hypothetical protein
MNRVKTFEIVGLDHLTRYYCCEAFYDAFSLGKIKFDKPDKYGNEYPYVEILTLLDNSNSSNSRLPQRSSSLVGLTFCPFCGYKYNCGENLEHTLYKHNQYFTV